MSAEAVRVHELKREHQAEVAENERLRAELDRLRATLLSSSADERTLAVALGESRARADALEAAEAAARERARLMSDIAIRLKRSVDTGNLQVTLRDGRIVLRMPSDLLFDSGQATVSRRGQTALRSIADVLKGVPDRRFQVAGHTDAEPIDTTRFPSNWELSTARAVSVVRALVALGVAPGALSAAGYGEFDPVGANDAAAGRAKNRRIEITLQPDVREIITIPE